MEWRGAALLPIQIFTCDRCTDVPQEQFRAIVLPADPVPVQLPFPEPFLSDEGRRAALTTGSTTDPATGLPVPGTTRMNTSAGGHMTAVPYGRNPRGSGIGLDANAVMPLATVNGVVEEFGVPLVLISVTANGTDQIAVTCAVAHGLATGGQIAVTGLTNPQACGFFSVVAVSATALTYQTYALAVPSGALLGPAARIITARVGLPRGYDTIEQVGPS